MLGRFSLICWGYLLLIFLLFFQTTLISSNSLSLSVDLGVPVLTWSHTGGANIFLLAKDTWCMCFQALRRVLCTGMKWEERSCHAPDNLARLFPPSFVPDHQCGLLLACVTEGHYFVIWEHLQQSCGDCPTNRITFTRHCGGHPLSKILSSFLPKTVSVLHISPEAPSWVFSHVSIISGSPLPNTYVLGSTQLSILRYLHCCVYQFTW